MNERRQPKGIIDMFSSLFLDPKPTVNSPEDGLLQEQTDPYFSYRVKDSESYFLIKNGKRVKRETSEGTELSSEASGKCPACGGPYPGPVGNSCIYCGSILRESFIWPKRSREKPPQPTFIQTTGTEISEKQSNPRKGTNIGPNSNMASVSEADTLKVGPGGNIKNVYASEVELGTGFRGGSIVAKKLTAEAGTVVGSVLIENNGQATFADNTVITNLYVGRDVTNLTFGNNCKIGYLIRVERTRIDAGENFEVKDTRFVNSYQFADIRQNMIN